MSSSAGKDQSSIKLVFEALKVAGKKGLLKSQLRQILMNETEKASSEDGERKLNNALNRKVERCIDALITSGACIQRERREKCTLFLMTKGPSWDTSLSAEVGLALQLAALVLSHAGTDLWHDKLDQLEALVSRHLLARDQKLLERLKRHVRVFGGVDDPIQMTGEPILEPLLDAIERQRKVELTYHLEKSFPVKTAPCIITHDLFSSGAYLLGWDEKNKTPKLYKLSRIESVKILENEFAIITEPEKMDRAIRYHIGSWIGGDEPFEVVARLEGDFWMRVMTEARPALPDFTVTPEDGGEKCMIRFKANATHGPIRWLLQFGRRVDVLEPEFLREQFRQELNAMLNKL